MVTRAIGAIGAAVAALACSAAAAEDADYYRGGWRSAAGPPQIYEFVISGRAVTGIACTRCADGTTLARLEGHFDPQGGLAFDVRHLKADGSLAAVDHRHARLREGGLVVTGGRVEQVLIKDPRGPTPAGMVQAIMPPGAPPVRVVPVPGGGAPAQPQPYVQPAPWRRLSPRDIAGVWLGFGVGIEKQYFVIRRDGARLFGLACGRCDNPYTFGALEHFAIHGDTVEFDIMHEDWGEGDKLPFVRHVTAHVAMNEMRIDARRPDVPGGAPIVASLLGPIALKATAGNAYGE